MGQWIGFLLGHNNKIQAGGIDYCWARHHDAGPYYAAGWRLKPGDRFYAADIDGDGKDEFVVVSPAIPDGHWIGILEQQGSDLRARWLTHTWVNHPGGSGANGWRLKQGDKFYAADIDGDGKDELVVVSPDGVWIGILEEQDGALRARWLTHAWVNHPGGSGANGWRLKQGDRFYAVDIDGDGKDELVVVSPDGVWIGILEEQGGALRARWLTHAWVNHPGGSGANGWRLKQGDKFYAVDIDGDGKDELVVVSPDGVWIGILEQQGSDLRARWLTHAWVNHPGGSGANGWRLKQGDKFYAVDIDGDGKDELVVVSPDGVWIGILEQQGSDLRARWLTHAWVNHPGGSGANGWRLKRGDKFYAVDIDGDGKDELVVVSPDGVWIGILEQQGSDLRARWLTHAWVNHPGGSGDNGWRLRKGDRFVSSKHNLLVTSPVDSLPAVRLHFKILKDPSRVSIADKVSSMVTIYASRGIRVEIASTEYLDLPHLNDLEMDGCYMGKPTDEQNELFQNRNFVGDNEIVIYFVNSITGYDGCAAHPDGRPGAVVARDAGLYTLAHEVGHILGLRHVEGTQQLMIGSLWYITNPPPDLTVDEGDTMKRSNLIINI